ncbi:M24 family metallopeptidase [Dictyobacter arantiisoli]|uniref:Peptidase M24 n=1 Tax=Dictyobacter arantiisoli TaxID=2014874 RepID=A0A5A5TH99_9CHLR|nr:M24 family metallopeptidase [Dictyobacter arantiisoli]GCF10588.1 peptidase M24 [Dictyobacter arantiisoli]
MIIERIQQVLREAHLDGWLFYDFHKSNPIAYQVLQLPVDTMYTRRWFYYVPAEGTPVAIISAVESHVLRSLPGARLSFQTWQDMHVHLRSFLSQGARVAMEYSPLNAIPYVSRVDAGTVELIRSFGVEVVTSANLAQHFIAQLTPEQIASHRKAGRLLIAAKDALFAQLQSDLSAGKDLNEYQVQQRFVALIQAAGLALPEDEMPIVAVNGNASNPHYEPTVAHYSPIRRGDLILFDFWAKLPQPEAVFADYTWMAFAGTRDEIPARQREVFEVVRDARDSAIAFIRESLAAGRAVEGRAADDVARNVVTRAGYAEYFVHRTGHSIGPVLHGNGANVDNFETQDERTLLPSTCNSIEPGIYLPEFGIRSEVDLLISEHDAEVTGVPIQTEISPLL